MPTVGTGNVWSTNVAAANGAVNQGSCASSTYVLGYYGYFNAAVYSGITGFSNDASMFPDSARITYNNPSFTTAAHYGVHFRATLLFIDDWVNGMSILFTEGGFNRFQFQYQMENMPGEYLCGYSTYDHQDVVDFTFNHTSNSINMDIYASVNLSMWGIKEVQIHVLTCHSTCATCFGPT